MSRKIRKNIVEDIVIKNNKKIIFESGVRNAPYNDSERTMKHFKLTNEEWNDLSEEEQRTLIGKLPLRNGENIKNKNMKKNKINFREEEDGNDIIDVTEDETKDKEKDTNLNDDDEDVDVTEEEVDNAIDELLSVVDVSGKVVQEDGKFYIPEDVEIELAPGNEIKFTNKDGEEVSGTLSKSDKDGLYVIDIDNNNSDEDVDIDIENDEEGKTGEDEDVDIENVKDDDGDDKIFEENRFNQFNQEYSYNYEEEDPTKGNGDDDIDIESIKNDDNDDSLLKNNDINNDDETEEENKPVVSDELDLDNSGDKDKRLDQIIDNLISDDGEIDAIASLTESELTNFSESSNSNFVRNKLNSKKINNKFSRENNTYKRINIDVEDIEDAVDDVLDAKKWNKNIKANKKMGASKKNGNPLGDNDIKGSVVNKAVLHKLGDKYDKIKSEAAKLKLENYKLLKVNGILTLMEDVKQETKEKLIEKIEKSNTMLEVKKIYDKIIEAVRDSRKPLLNEMIENKKTNITTLNSGKEMFDESINDKRNNGKMLDKDQRRLNSLMGIKGFEDDYFKDSID